MNLSIGGDLVPTLPSLGGREKLRRPRTFFKKKNSILTAKISDDHFLVIVHDFRIFPIFHIFAACNVVYDPFFTRKTPISKNNSFTTPFFNSVRAFARIRQTLAYTSQNIGGRMHGPSPHLKFWGTVLPSSPPVNLSH